MTPRLTTDYAKNYCNRRLIVKVIVENVVTCFFMGHSVLSRVKSSHNLSCNSHVVGVFATL